MSEEEDEVATIMVVHAGAVGLEAHVRARYSPGWSVVAVGSEEAARNELRRLRESSARLALVITTQHVLGGGLEFLASTGSRHPMPGLVLVRPSGDLESGLATANERRIDGYVESLDSPDLSLYPTVDRVLADWRVRAALPYLLVEQIMTTGSAIARIDSSATVGEAAAVLAATRAGDLMVVDARDALVGKLAEGDIFRGALPDFDEIVDAGGTLDDAFGVFTKKAIELAGKPITPLVIRDPLALAPATMSRER
jgi:hypothetical protein